jgi:hypothetical protein
MTTTTTYPRIRGVKPKLGKTLLVTFENGVQRAATALRSCKARYSILSRTKPSSAVSRWILTAMGSSGMMILISPSLKYGSTDGPPNEKMLAMLD